MKQVMDRSLKDGFEKRPKLVKDREVKKQALIDRAYEAEVSKHDSAVQRRKGV